MRSSQPGRTAASPPDPNDEKDPLDGERESALVARFLPADAGRIEGAALRRIWLIVVCVGIVVPLFLAAAVSLVWADRALGFQSAALAGASASFLTCLLVLRRTASHAAAGGLFCATLLAVQAFLAATDSGVADSALYFAPVIPLIAAFMVGPRTAVLFAGLVTAEVVALYALEVWGHPFPFVTARADHAAFAAMSLLLTTLFCTGLAWHYEGYTLVRLRGMNDKLRRLQAQLESREAHYRALVQRSSDTITVIGRDGRIRYQSPAVRQNLGYDPADTAGRPVLDFVHPEDRPRVGALLDAFLARGAAEGDGLSALSFRCQHADGHYVHIETVGTNMLGTPHVDGVVFNARDVTKRKQVEEALRAANEQLEHHVAAKTADLAQANESLQTELAVRRRNERFLEQLAALLEHAQDVVFMFDIDGTLQYWNRSAAELYGLGGAEWYGRHAYDLLAPPVDSRHEAAVETVMAEGEWSGELHLHTRIGREVTVESRWTLVRGEEEGTGSILVVNTDITERKALLRRAQRVETIGRLAGGIAHDINNVLGPIMMSLELLEHRTPTDDPVVQRLLNSIEQGTQRGADLVRQLLAYMRGARGERAAIALAPVVDEVCDLLADTLPREIHLATDVDEAVGTVTEDPTQLHQVLLNLVVNARDAMAEGGELRIEAKNRVLDAVAAAAYEEGRPGHFAVLSVRDTGRGMPPDVLARVFEPFFTTKVEGSGIGLATVADIVRTHGGFIGVESAEGVGTRFDVFLPAAEAEPTNGEAVAKGAVRGGGQRVLVVDDKSAIRTAACGVLETHGYRTVSATDGAAALDVIAREPDVRCVLTDIMMPGMDGRTLARALAARAPGIPVIGMSGLVSREDPGTEHDPFVDFLAKPFTAAALTGAVHDALGAAPASEPALAE